MFSNPRGIIYMDLKPESRMFVDQITNLALSIASFHERFELFRHVLLLPPFIHGNDAYRNGYTERGMIEHLKSRVSLLVEETGEHAKALNHDSLYESFAELVDIAYIVLGSIYSAGEFADLVVEEVVEKNNEKTLESHHVNESGKVVRNEN